MAIDIAGLDHIVLRVKDMELSLKFYRDFLGCQEERRVESMGLVQLRAGHSLIDLLPAESGQSVSLSSLDHFCLKLTSFDEAQIVQQLENQGVEFSSPQNRYGAQGYGPSIYIQDPDGNTVELKG